MKGDDKKTIEKLEEFLKLYKLLNGDIKKIIKVKQSVNS